jgi:hypothetical protein
LALAFKLTNDPLVFPLFKKANSRIYAALLGMDAVIDAANCGSTTTPVIIGDWADSYKTFMTNLLTSAGTSVNTKVSQVLGDNARLGPSAQVGPGSTTGADGKATATVNSIGRGVSAFLAAYPTPNAFTFDVPNLIEFPTTATLNIKRQACSRPPPSDGSSTSDPSATQTSLSSSSPTSVVSVSESSVSPSSSAPISSSSSASITTPPPQSSSAIPSSTVIAASSTSTAGDPAESTFCPAGCECLEGGGVLCS